MLTKDNYDDTVWWMIDHLTKNMHAYLDDNQIEQISQKIEEVLTLENVKDFHAVTTGE